jgi:hypothetical protein
MGLTGWLFGDTLQISESLSFASTAHNRGVKTGRLFSGPCSPMQLNAGKRIEGDREFG